MANLTHDSRTRTALRLRAAKQLTGAADGHGTRAEALTALGVLHAMAASPSTAADALALMHELQVHQVELDLQEEELRQSRIELEAALARSHQLYDGAPVGLFTVERSTQVVELNSSGARILGTKRAALLGRPLDLLLTTRGSDMLHTLLAQVAESGQAQACTLELASRDGVARQVHANACSDPAGPRFLIALLDAADRPPTSKGL